MFKKLAIFFGTLIVFTFVLSSCNRTTTPVNQKPQPSPTITTTQENSSKFTCPSSEWVNCMPGPDAGDRPECNSTFLQWAQDNCPNFKGAAY